MHIFSTPPPEPLFKLQKSIYFKSMFLGWSRKVKILYISSISTLNPTNYILESFFWFAPYSLIRLRTDTPEKMFYRDEP